jgi:hypothetical protein
VKEGRIKKRKGEGKSREERRKNKGGKAGRAKGARGEQQDDRRKEEGTGEEGIRR